MHFDAVHAAIRADLEALNPGWDYEPPPEPLVRSVLHDDGPLSYCVVRLESPCLPAGLNWVGTQEYASVLAVLRLAFDDHARQCGCGALDGLRARYGGR